MESIKAYAEANELARPDLPPEDTNSALVVLDEDGPPLFDENIADLYEDLQSHREFSFNALRQLKMHAIPKDRIPGT